jgi:DNA modification methylase
MKNYSIYNKSSENMSEIADASVDIVVFAPPYNIDTQYSDKKDYDYKSFEAYRDMMNQIIKECSRVLNKDGLYLNESADTIYSKGKLIALSGLIQKLCLDNGLKIKERHINFLQSDNGVELLDIEHHWSSDYYSTEDSHSNCHQWFIMSKDPATKFNAPAGKIFYVNYPANEEGHPCPFSQEHIDIFLNLLGFKKGMTVLEPFMGTSRLGVEVVKRGGKYIGYELETKHFDTAKLKFEALN